MAAAVGYVLDFHPFPPFFFLLKSLQSVDSFIPLHICPDVGGGQEFVGPDGDLGRERCVDGPVEHLLRGSKPYAR